MNFSLANLDKITLDDKPAKKSFVDLFVSEMELKELPSLLSSWKKKDLVSLKSSAHSIKSNAKFFGMTHLAERLQKIEDISAQEAFSSEMSKEIASVQAEIKKVCSEMSEWSTNFR